MLLIIVVGVAVKSVFLLVAQRQVGYTAAQVATDLRLFLKQRVSDLLRAQRELVQALVELAERNADLALPGYTHFIPMQDPTMTAAFIRGERPDQG